MSCLRLSMAYSAVLSMLKIPDRGVMIGNSDETNLEMAYKDLIDTYFILEKGVGNSSFGFGIASVSYSGLEMKLSLRGF